MDILNVAFPFAFVAEAEDHARNLHVRKKCASCICPDIILVYIITGFSLLVYFIFC